MSDQNPENTTNTGAEGHPPTSPPPSAPAPSCLFVHDEIKAPCLKAAQHDGPHLCVARPDGSPVTQLAELEALNSQVVAADGLVTKLKLLGPNGTPARPETAPTPKPFERDSPALTRARGRLWETLQAIELEIIEAQAAFNASAKNKRPPSLEKFIARLKAARLQIAVLHATAYCGTLEERYDALQPLCVEAIRAAQDAGIKVQG